MKDLVIGLDSSTTGCKAVVFDRTGAVVALERASQPLLKPKPGWHEQPAESWWAAACQALREAAGQIDPARLAGISITTQRETYVVVDAAGKSLSNGLVWMDERARDRLGEIDRSYTADSLPGKTRVHQETGKPLSANLSLAKLDWLRVHQPGVFAQIGCVLDVHAYLALQLTGKAVTSWGCADPMGLFDMRHNTWDAALIRTIGLHLDQFPEAAPIGALIGEISSEAAQACGLPAGLPLAAGIGDGQAAALGVCAIQSGEACLNLGTAIVSGTFSTSYRTDPAYRTHYSGLPGAYDLETVLLGGTYTISWLVEQFGKSIEELESAAACIPAGAEGLVLVPYWNTALNPYWDPTASGITIGWRGIHGPGHLYRAILEGIALEQRLHTEGVEQSLGQPVARYIAVGGGARSRLWGQILADVTGREVYRAETPDGAPLVEASALGAGILAASAVGLFNGTTSDPTGVLAAAQAMTRRSAQPDQPDKERAAFYTRLYEDVYRDLYPTLRATLSRLAGLVE